MLAHSFAQKRHTNTHTHIQSHRIIKPEACCHGWFCFFLSFFFPPVSRGLSRNITRRCRVFRFRLCEPAHQILQTILEIQLRRLQIICHAQRQKYSMPITFSECPFLKQSKRPNLAAKRTNPLSSSLKVFRRCLARDVCVCVR